MPITTLGSGDYLLGTPASSGNTYYNQVVRYSLGNLLTTANLPLPWSDIAAPDGNFTINGLGALSLTAIPSGQVLGNSGSSSAEPSATSLTGLLDRAFGTTVNNVLARGSGGWNATNALTLATLGLTDGSSTQASLHQILPVTNAGPGTGIYIGPYDLIRLSVGNYPATSEFGGASGTTIGASARSTSPQATSRTEPPASQRRAAAFRRSAAAS